jgi:dihydroorotase
MTAPDHPFAVATPDLVITGGSLLDAASGHRGPGDVAISAGRIVAIGPGLGPGRETLDVGGRLVLPGLIDIHTHVFPGYHGADPDVVCLPRGTTTAFDGGSAGARAIGLFRDTVAATRRTRIGAWLNLSTIGLVEISVGELQQLLYVNVEMAVEAAQAHPDLVVGFKVRISEAVVGGDFRPVLRLARQAGDAAGLPLLVHIGDTDLPLSEALLFLRAGDVVTHAYSGRRNGIFDRSGAVSGAVRDARRAGVRFDGAHGRRHFSFESARRALAQDFPLDTLSSDISRRAITDASSHLPLVMTKLMACGASLDDVAALVTTSPAAILGRTGELGTLAPGAAGDVAILELDEAPRTLVDAEGDRLETARSLRPWRTVRGGIVVTPPAGA